MNSPAPYLLLACSAIVLLCDASAASAMTCPNMMFYDATQGQCVPCSVCGPNQIPHRQCFGNQDTSCGPMPRFNFGQMPVESKSEPDNATPEPVADNVEVDHDQDASEEDQRQTATTLVVQEDAADKWFMITMILIGILVVTCIVGVVATLVFCVAYKKKHRQIIYQPTLTVDDSYHRVAQFAIMQETDERT